MHYQMEHIVVERSEWTRPPHIVAHRVWPVEILDSSVLLGVIRIVPCDLAAYLQVTSPLEASTYMLLTLLIVCVQWPPATDWARILYD
jgi:hypothetical protein